MFSSASCINGSFLEKRYKYAQIIHLCSNEHINQYTNHRNITLFFFIVSSDKHYKTSIGNSGLDLSLARVAFEKLAKKDKVLLEVWVC